MKSCPPKDNGTITATSQPPAILEGLTNRELADLQTALDRRLQEYNFPKDIIALIRRNSKKVIKQVNARRIAKRRKRSLLRKQTEAETKTLKAKTKAKDQD